MGPERSLADSPSPAGRRRATAPSGASPRRSVHGGLLVVLGAYVASAFVVPTLAPVGVSDDFVYARSVDILVSDGKMVILPATAATLVFQAVWGALFSAIFGHSFGVLRVATVVFTLGSSVALYGLCREMGVNKARSALGAAVFLFNPLSYVLSFTFMTDPYLVGLLTMSAFCYVRALRDGEIQDRWMVAGSVVAALAFLVRHQGILIPLGVVTYLYLSRRLRRDRPSLRVVLQALLVPVVVAIAYLLWFRFIHGVPENNPQVDFLRAWSDAGPSGIVGLARRLLFLEAMFVGLFTLPIGLGALPRLPALVRSSSRRTWLVFGAVVTPIGIIAVTYGPGKWIPWVSHFLQTSGLGPNGDLHGGRVPLVGNAVRSVATIACAVAGLVVLLALCRRLLGKRTSQNAPAGVVLSLLLWQGVGVLAVSMLYRESSISYDRYMLPLLPLAICLGLWALSDVGLSLRLAVAVTAGMAALSVVGTRDFLSYQSATWEVARQAHEAGVPYDRLDAGAAWDGYHLYEASYRRKATLEFPKDMKLTGPLLLSEHDVVAWWHGFYAPALRPNYFVSAEPLLTLEVVQRIEYSTWLQPSPTYMYLLRLPDVRGPP